MKNEIGVSEEELTNAFLELIRRTSTILPDDVVEKIKQRRDKEETGSRWSALDAPKTLTIGS